MPMGTQVLTTRTSYEALPPNYGLTHNMLAGAFAGIAVRKNVYRDGDGRLTGGLGTYGDVPCGFDEGMNETGSMGSLWMELLMPGQTRMQVINPTSGTIYSGIASAASTITRVEGFKTLWRGMSSVVVGAGMVQELETIAGGI
jgi:solute carrier family 25 (mitochondrial iron transporter), member 28/37